MKTILLSFVPFAIVLSPLQADEETFKFTGKSRRVTAKITDNNLSDVAITFETWIPEKGTYGKPTTNNYRFEQLQSPGGNANKTDERFEIYQNDVKVGYARKMSSKTSGKYYWVLRFKKSERPGETAPSKEDNRCDEPPEDDVLEGP